MAAHDEQKHVFISYVRENRQIVDKFCEELAKHGVHIWLDRNKIQPGVRWKDAIRNAIRRGNFFIACFSKEYTSREKSYMNEELTLAIEELRQFSTNRVWFIPVLFSECDVPARSIGAGETLLDINWVALFEDWDAGIQRILDVIRPIPSEIQDLIKSLSSPHLDVRKSAANALGKIGDPVSVPALLGAAKDVAPDVRGSVATALGKIGDPAAVPALTAALGDENLDVRLHAAEALGEISDPAALPPLTAALGGRSLDTDTNVAGTSGGLFDPEAAPLSPREIKDTLFRIRIVLALFNIGGPAVVPALTAALGNENPDVRLIIVMVLGKIGDPAALPALTAALGDENPKVRELAAKALAKIRDPEQVKQ